MSNKRNFIVAFLLVSCQLAFTQVGIGTQDPDEALDLEDATSSEVNLGINNTSTGDPLLHFQVGSVTTFSIGVDNSDNDNFKIGTTDLATGTSLLIDGNGDVGINDSDPVYKLEVDGDINLSSSTRVYRIGSAHVLSKPNTKNIYVGEGAGAQNNAGGTDNSYVGYQAGYSSTTGDYNLCFGSEAGYSNQGGANNISLGRQAGYSATSADGSIRVGYQSGYGSTGSNTLYLDNSSSSNPLMYVSSFSSTDELDVNGGLIVNEQSGAFDFRVETDNKTHALFVEAANEYVFLGSNNNATNRQVQINGTSSTAGASLSRFSNDANGSSLGFAKSRGSEGSPSIVIDNDVIGNVKFVANDGLDFAHTSATIEAKINDTPGSNDMPTELRFQTTPDGSNSQSIRMVIEEDGSVGINNTSPTNPLKVEEASATVATFNRTTDDGIVVDFQYNGTTEGNIAVAGGTVTYNPFTGAHFAYSLDTFNYGSLVVLNGDNRNYHDNPNSEILYGISYSTKENDKRVLGSYSGLLESELSFSVDNPHQVMAVGNGKMWVTNQGGSIKIGDYLITSSTAGCAMKDNGEHPISYVCARAAQKVNWRKVKPDQNGVKKALVSVFYESFEVENLSEEIKALENGINSLKKSLHSL